MSVESEAQPASVAPASRKRGRLSPELIIAAGCLLGVISFGPRSAIGQFQLPILGEFPIRSEAFSVAMALQYLLWGMGQPFAGALADRYGTGVIMSIGGVVYAAALTLMTVSASETSFALTAGVLYGLALSFCSFNLIIGSFMRLLPPERRSVAFGIATGAGSFGQFLFSPLAGGMIQAFGWKSTLLIFAVLMFATIPLAYTISTRGNKNEAPAAGGQQQTFTQAMREAFSHRSYLLLVLGYFTCGFQLAFVTVHFQRYVVESGLPANVGYWAFALVGIFNIIGSMTSGWLGNYVPKRYILSFIYLSRALVTLLFISMPISSWSTYLFGVLTGLLWLSTVPPTSALVGSMFGPRYFSTLYGFAFFNHQLGGFLALMIAGWLREATGSYAVVWWLSMFFGVMSALINLPIVEKPVERAQPA